MAALCSCASGDFGTSSTWQVIEPTSIALPNLTSGNNQNITTGAAAVWTYCSTFTPGSAITIDGIGAFINYITTGADSLFIQLYDQTATALVSGTDCSMSLANAPGNHVNTDQHIGWIFVDFTTSVTLISGHVYQIRLWTTNANSVYTRMTAGSKHACFARLTTTGTPGAGDTIIIVGRYSTVNATYSQYDVTYGANDSTTAYNSIWVGTHGSFSFLTAASATYYLKMDTYASRIIITYGGVFNIGTTNARMPKTSTATLYFDNFTSRGTSWLYNYGGTFSVAGDNTRLNQTKITSTANSGQAVVNVADVTGWANSDSLFIATSPETGGANSNRYETKVISTMSSLAVTLTGNLSYTRTYNATYDCEVCNLTRNILITANTLYNYGWCYLGGRGSTTTLDNVICDYMFPGTGCDGISIFGTYGGAATINGCVFTNQKSSAYITIGAESVLTTATVSITNNVFVNPINTTLNCTAYASSTVTIDDFFVGGSTSNVNFASLASNAVNVNNLRVNSVTTGGSVNLAGTGTTGGTWTNWYFHSCNCGVLYSAVALPDGVTFTNIKIFACSTAINIYCPAPGATVTFNNVTCVNTISHNFWYNNTAECFNSTVIFNNCTFANGTEGISIANSNCAGFIKYYNCTFTSNTKDIEFKYANTSAFIILNNSPVTTIDLAYMVAPGYIIDARDSSSISTYYTIYGKQSSDTAISDSASKSLRLTPNSSSVKLNSTLFYVPVKANAATVFTIKVRKSVVGDPSGVAYNGNQPRLMLSKNTALGNAVDTMQQTASLANGNWEILSSSSLSATTNTIAAFYVDCDGTTGWVNVDTITNSAALDDSTGLTYNYNGKPFMIYGSNSESSSIATTGSAILLGL